MALAHTFKELFHIVYFTAVHAITEEFSFFFDFKPLIQAIHIKKILNGGLVPPLSPQQPFKNRISHPHPPNKSVSCAPALLESTRMQEKTELFPNSRLCAV